MSTWCCRVVSTTTALRHQEFEGTLGGSHILTSKMFFDHLDNLSPRDTVHQFLEPCFLNGGSVGGIKEVFKICYSLHRSTTYWVEVSNTPSPLQTVLAVPCFPLLRQQMVVQNFLEDIQKSFSMASTNCSHARVFASETAVAALCLACQSPSAASGVSQAKKLLRQLDGIPHCVSTNGFGYYS